MGPCQGFESFESLIAEDKILKRQMIYQLDRRVVSNLQLFRKLSDGNRFPIWKALNRQQGLMLLGSQSHGSVAISLKRRNWRRLYRKAANFSYSFFVTRPFP
jgi:hypothetical protein